MFDFLCLGINGGRMETKTLDLKAVNNIKYSQFLNSKNLHLLMFGNLK